MNNELYDKTFFETRLERTQIAAERVLTEVFDIYKPDSVIDVGCGTGTWLSVCQQKGIQDIQGIEGPWLPKNIVEIEYEKIFIQNIEDKVKSEKKYDLSISLEVAEHLTPDRAQSFIKDICDISPVILFSAAIPGQGGLGHINEQWPSYWHKIFNEIGYVGFDLIRPRIWNDVEIRPFYRQNIFIFVDADSDIYKSFDKYKNIISPIDIVHPSIFAQHHLRRMGLKKSISRVKKSFFQLIGVDNYESEVRKELQKSMKM